MTMEQLSGKDLREDEDDVEVMQVVAKRGTDDELNRERPMSWEGELSEEDEAMSDHHLQLLCPTAAPPSSPMCVVADKEASSEKRTSVEVNMDSAMKASTGSSSGNSSPTSQISGFVATVSSRSPFPQAPSPSERPRSGHSALHAESPLSNHRSPAQSRHMIGYSAPYSQSPSPVLTRPTSSSSSRSSYSPTQSPLLGRHISSTSHAHSPVLPRHATGTSSDGSLYSPTNSPLQGRHISAESSVYSPTQSPSQGRHILPDSASSFSPSQSPAHLRSTVFSRPMVFAASPSPTPLHRSATVTPEQSGETLIGSYSYGDGGDGRILQSVHHNNHEGRLTASSASVASSASDESNASDFSSPTRRHSADAGSEDLSVSGTSSISRQQLLSGPCPICGDRISGFHYGIFSCESCKGFFKRTVQNKKNYVCLRGAKCVVAISTRKKCPACRFDKCLKMGMKLEAIREDRTRGGRSTYQCSYTLSTQSLSDGRGSDHLDGSPVQLAKCEYFPHSDSGVHSAEDEPHGVVPLLIQEILAVEHLWHYTDKEMGRLSEQYTVERPPNRDPDFLNNLCNIADHRLFKIVKWCKSLPLFRDIGTDDQIALLINVWCELLLLSCCYRSVSTPNEIRVSLGKSMNLSQARGLGLGPVIERMLNLTEHLRRLQVDQHEYVCLKVIILLTSDASGLKEPEKVRACQKQVLEALQTYTRTHYPQQPSKFGELLLRIPELERACQVGKESLASKQRAGEVPSFNLLMELLRGDH